MKTAVRTILTSKDTFQQQPLVKEKEDIIVHSPYSSLEYPDISIEDYVFADVNKWENKTALVSEFFFLIFINLINFSTGRHCEWKFCDLRSTSR